MATERETSSLATQLAELASRPAGDTRIERWRAGAISLAHRATTWGPLEPVAEIGWRTLRRDASIGGSVLGAALAYRIFIWLLPFALTVVLALALIAGRSHGNIAELVERRRAHGRRRQLRRGSDRRDVRLGDRERPRCRAGGAALPDLGAPSCDPARSPRSRGNFPSRECRARRDPVSSSSRWLVAFLVVAGSAAPLRRALDFPVDLVLDLVVYSAGLPLLWLLLSWFLLPHRAERWLDLVPGALVVGFGVGAIGLVSTLVLFPWLAERQETYGVLGVAAGLLFGFFLIGRTMELAAALNATLDEERRRRVAR